jgi:hypothetical protein
MLLVAIDAAHIVPVSRNSEALRVVARCFVRQIADCLACIKHGEPLQNVMVFGAV